MKKLLKEITNLLSKNRIFDEYGVVREYVELFDNKLLIAEIKPTDPINIHTIGIGPSKYDSSIESVIKMYKEDTSGINRRKACINGAKDFLSQIMPEHKSEIELEANNLEVEELLSEF